MSGVTLRREEGRAQGCGIQRGPTSPTSARSSRPGTRPQCPAIQDLARITRIPQIAISPKKLILINSYSMNPGDFFKFQWNRKTEVKGVHWTVFKVYPGTQTVINDSKEFTWSWICLEWKWNPSAKIKVTPDSQFNFPENVLLLTWLPQLSSGFQVSLLGLIFHILWSLCVWRQITFKLKSNWRKPLWEKKVKQGVLFF